MKRLLVALFILLLTAGCARTVNQQDIQRAQEMCSAHDGLHRIEDVTLIGESSHVEVVCRDGTYARRRFR